MPYSRVSTDSGILGNPTNTRTGAKRQRTRAKTSKYKKEAKN
jgi:hypothetical protein